MQQNNMREFHKKLEKIEPFKSIAEVPTVLSVPKNPNCCKILAIMRATVVFPEIKGWGE